MSTSYTKMVDCCRSLWAATNRIATTNDLIEFWLFLELESCLSVFHLNNNNNNHTITVEVKSFTFTVWCGLSFVSSTTYHYIVCRTDCMCGGFRIYACTVPDPLRELCINKSSRSLENWSPHTNLRMQLGRRAQSLLSNLNNNSQNDSEHLHVVHTMCKRSIKFEFMQWKYQNSNRNWIVSMGWPKKHENRFVYWVRCDWRLASEWDLFLILRSGTMPFGVGWCPIDMKSFLNTILATAPITNTYIIIIIRKYTLAQSCDSRWHNSNNLIESFSTAR